MSANNNGGPAFPLQFDPYVDHPAHGRIHREAVGESIQEGMTLRDYFAAKAITGYLPGDCYEDYEINNKAKRAYAVADAMLRARETD